ncbi:MAG TPA: hypothetical protein VHP58_05860 [Alphaproteobacteria bacterium]|nr:hypothetical protein [Alphaproteobacteria bacterium]
MNWRYAVVLAGVFASPAHAVEALRLTYDAAGSPVTFERDNAGTIQVDGLPYPGLVLYRPSNGVVYYQHPDIPKWISVPTGTAVGVSATLAKGAAWEKWQDQPSYRYDLKVTDNGVQEDCGPLYASPGAGVQAGLNVADIWRILTAVAWLNAGKAAPACDRLVAEPAHGQAAGLPIHFNGPNGEWQLKELARTGVAKIDLPPAAEPVDEQARLDLMLRQFGPDERKKFLTQYSSLPLGQQVKLLEDALMGSGQP